MLLAKNEGKQIEFLPEGGKKKPDWLFDEQTWEIEFFSADGGEFQRIIGIVV